MSSHLHGFPDLPPIWALGALGVSALLARVLPLVILPRLVWPALLVGLAGVVLILWSALWFRRKATPIMPRETAKALIVEGPFRVNRNPIYTGMALILAGFALWFGALSAWLPVVAFPLIITRRFILGEEAGLRASFPGEAEAYLKATRRW